MTRLNELERPAQEHFPVSLKHQRNRKVVSQHKRNIRETNATRNTCLCLGRAGACARDQGREAKSRSGTSSCSNLKAAASHAE
jgi:hypothetical protein